MQVRTVALILIAFAAIAVQPLDAQFSVGINAGLHRMKFSGDPARGVGHFQPDPGFSTAVRVDYRISDEIALGLHPGFSQLRSRYQIMNDSGTSLIDSTLLRLNAFSLPLQVIVWSQNGRFFVTAGVQLDHTLGLTGETVTSTLSDQYEVRDFYLSAQFGAGFIVPLGKPYLSFEFRYSQGILDLTNPLVHQDSFLPRTKITNIGLIAGIQLPLGNYSEQYPVKKKIH